MFTESRLILSEIFSDEGRGQESVDFAPRREVGASFLLVGCGGLASLSLAFARRGRVRSLPDANLGCDVDFPGQVGYRLAGLAMVYHGFASAISPTAPGYFRNNIRIVPRRRLALPAQ